MATGWSRPEAWQGSVQVGDNAMPAQTIGDMALIEVMLHGWDLATATRQDLPVSESLAKELRTAIEDTAQLGRQMGAYEDEVEVGEHAGDFERGLGAAGRDPKWVA
jgi:uncharacterized protein (TIGR03086 family)